MVVEVILVLILASLWFGLYAILKQQGRILLRLDAIEKAAPEPPQPQGLDVGTEFPTFSLPDLEGNPVSLAAFRGRRLLLVHWSAQCGFCDLIAPDLVRLQPDFQARHVQLVLLAHGEAEANRKLAEEHGLTCPILLYRGKKVPEPLAHLGTPSAYLLDAECRVMKPVAIGSEDVPVLAEEAAKEEAPSAGESGSKRLRREKPISSSRIVRDGLKAGTPAPAFSLPDIYGDTISLSDYRGRRVLLAFSDPNCAPCDELAPELARFDRQYADGGLSMILVSRGEPEESRKKAEQHGIQFPVVMQEKWRLSKEYGIFSTPVAFLIDEKGVIAKDVAIGPDPILTLAQEGVQTGKDSRYELSYR